MNETSELMRWFEGAVERYWKNGGNVIAQGSAATRKKAGVKRDPGAAARALAGLPSDVEVLRMWQEMGSHGAVAARLGVSKSWVHLAAARARGKVWAKRRCRASNPQGLKAAA